MSIYNGLLTGDDLREILRDDVSLDLFRVDEKIRQKIRDFGWTTSIDVSVSVRSVDEVQQLLHKRGFKVSVSRSDRDEQRCSLDIRWVGAGCPEDAPPTTEATDARHP